MRLPLQQGFLVVQRINWFANPLAGQPVPSRSPAIPLSHDSILRAYCGFEGRAWPPAKSLDSVGLDAGLVPHTQMRSLEAYVSEASKVCPVSVLYCQVGAAGPLPALLTGRAFFAGFDYGVFDPVEDSFSVVFNEVIYGSLQGMRSLVQRLNRDLLLRTLEDADLVALTRRRLEEEGADLERFEADEKSAPVAMYRVKSISIGAD